jgi:hypothetical protein
MGEKVPPQWVIVLSLDLGGGELGRILGIGGDNLPFLRRPLVLKNTSLVFLVIFLKIRAQGGGKRRPYQ